MNTQALQVLAGCAGIVLGVNIVYIVVESNDPEFGPMIAVTTGCAMALGGLFAIVYGITTGP